MHHLAPNTFGYLHWQWQLGKGCMTEPAQPRNSEIPAQPRNSAQPRNTRPASKLRNGVLEASRSNSDALPARKRTNFEKARANHLTRSETICFSLPFSFKGGSVRRTDIDAGARRMGVSCCAWIQGGELDGVQRVCVPDVEGGWSFRRRRELRGIYAA